jgi:hypothetical protein
MDMVTIVIPEWVVWLVVVVAILETILVLCKITIIWMGWQIKRLKGEFPPISELFFGRKKK